MTQVLGQRPGRVLIDLDWLEGPLELGRRSASSRAQDFTEEGGHWEGDMLEQRRDTGC